jgi:DNA-binding Xre family transcriptional regulator
MKEMEKVEIHLYKETIEKIKKYTEYENLKNQVKPESNRSTVHSVEDFITGCINLYLKELESIENLAGMDDLGKPFRLRNRFKEIITKRGIKQKELAKMTDIDAGNISIILSNRSQPSLDYFLRIWLVLGCPPIQNVLYREDI